MRFTELYGYIDGSLQVAGTFKAVPVYEDGKRVEGAQKRNDDGVLLWQASCIYLPEDEEQEPEQVRIKVASATCPQVRRGQMLGMPDDGFAVVPYERDGRIAYSITAPESCLPVAKAAAPAAKVAAPAVK